MAQIDLDDLPPRVAQTLAKLAPGEELVIVRGGALVARLTVAVAPRKLDAGTLSKPLAPPRRAH